MYRPPRGTGKRLTALLGQKLNIGLKPSSTFLNKQIASKNKFVEMKSLRGKPRSIMFLGFNSLISQQAAGNLTQERLKYSRFCT
jgi:hypothetical protein